MSNERHLSDPSLVLFDMDKTLIDVSRHYIEAYRIALQTVFGIDGEPNHERHPGNTQVNIMRAICEEKGVPPGVISDRLGKAMEVLASETLARLDSDLSADVLPGVIPLLDELQRRDNALALVTCTIARIGNVVLKRSGLRRYFPARAFGDEVSTREDLLRLAVDRADSVYDLDVVPKTRPPLVVIGDAPRDLQAGRAIGAKVIAVATGYHSVQDLKAHHPDEILPGFEDWEAAANCILAA
jgi:beta-phosphoglucomutase-like phosphatase (HAD superfamily)